MLSRDGRKAGVTGPGILMIASLVSALPLTAQGVTPSDGVTVERVERGLRLYHTKGACLSCHGELGVGSTEGPELVAGQWKLGPGTYEWLRHFTRHAGWGATSRNGDPQPMRGPTVLDSAEVSAVAAYVWGISRGRTTPANRP